MAVTVAMTVGIKMNGRIAIVTQGTAVPRTLTEVASVARVTGVASIVAHLG